MENDRDVMLYLSAFEEREGCDILVVYNAHVKYFMHRNEIFNMLDRFPGVPFTLTLWRKY